MDIEGAVGMGPVGTGAYSTVLNKRRGANKRRGVKNDENLINVGVQINVGGVQKLKNK